MNRAVRKADPSQTVLTLIGQVIFDWDGNLLASVKGPWRGCVTLNRQVGGSIPAHSKGSSFFMAYFKPFQGFLGLVFAFCQVATSQMRGCQTPNLQVAGSIPDHSNCFFLFFKFPIESFQGFIVGLVLPIVKLPLSRCEELRRLIYRLAVRLR